MSPRVRGFSLLELVMVMAVLAVAALVLLPRWQHSRERGLRAQIEPIRAALQETKLQAMASGRPQVFAWNPSTRVWTSGKSQGRISDDIQVAMTFGQERNTVPAQACIVFFADGLSTGGRLRFAGKSESRQLQVDWLTGQVREAEQVP